MLCCWVCGFCCLLLKSVEFCSGIWQAVNLLTDQLDTSKPCFKAVLGQFQSSPYSRVRVILLRHGFSGSQLNAGGIQQDLSSGRWNSDISLPFATSESSVGSRPAPAAIGCQSLQRLPLHKYSLVFSQRPQGAPLPISGVVFLHNCLLFVILPCQFQLPQKPWTLITVSQISEIAVHPSSSTSVLWSRGSILAESWGDPGAHSRSSFMNHSLAPSTFRVWKFLFHAFCPALQLNLEEG